MKKGKEKDEVMNVDVLR